MKVWHLNHSGVAVETENHLLSFDIFGEALTPVGNEGLEKGVINPAQMQDKDILFFVSHEHHDHFDPKIFGLDKMGKRVRYVLPEEFDEIFGDGIFVHANMQVQLEDCRITTFDSTDIGVAYLVEIDGMRIYHAGDLNWWHWEGEEESFNLDQATRYQHEMQQLKKTLQGKSLDLAFIPMDQRLEKDFARGVICFCESVYAKHIVPIHFWNDFDALKTMIQSLQKQDFYDRIVPVAAKGLILEDNAKRG